MSKATIKNNRLILLSLCIFFLFISCINELDSEISPGTVPIKFTTKINKTNTRVTNTAFDKGDKVGLYAMLSSTPITEKRYIDNLQLECGEKNVFIPEKTVFYPTGDATLNFISYYPYLSTGIEAGQSTIPVSVQTNQSSAKDLSVSDFMVASEKNVESSEEAVVLNYKHKLTKIKITITAGTGEDITKIYKANPQIIAVGFKSKAEYDTETDSFTNLREEADIIPFGEWSIIKGVLTGKEFIIIPQNADSETQSFIMEWNGKLYTCPMPELNMTGSTQCQIDIEAMQTTSHFLTGITGTVEDWLPGDSKDTNNSGGITTIHLAALTFSQSNIYRIYHEGKPIAEVCKEYLKSDNIDSRAIVAYPIKEDETCDLSKGVVLKFQDDKRAICGGTIQWNTDDSSFIYTEGNLQSVDKFYLNEKGEILLEETNNPISIDIVSHTIRDIRKGDSYEYPIVKIGTQYWMREDLCAMTYRDGTTLDKQTQLGEGAGYFRPQNTETYFYNGEAVLAGNLAPAEWKIPDSDDWQALKEYTKDNASILKAGEWEVLKEGDILDAGTNLTGFAAIPTGTWGNGENLHKGKFTGYWTLNGTDNSIPERTVSFTGSDAKFTSAATHITNATYYKAFSIRCIKE